MVLFWLLLELELMKLFWVSLIQGGRGLFKDNKKEADIHPLTRKQMDVLSSYT